VERKLNALPLSLNKALEALHRRCVILAYIHLNKPE